LGHADFRLREAAHRELARRGPVALPALLAARAHADPEVRRRSIDLAQHICRQMELAQLLAPTLVQVEPGERLVSVVLADLVRQTGMTVVLDPNLPDLATRRVTLTPGTPPFWAVVDELCQQARLVPSRTALAPTPSEEALMLRLNPRGPGLMPLQPLQPMERTRPTLLPSGSSLVLTGGNPQSESMQAVGSFRLRVLPLASTTRPTPQAGGVLIGAEVEPRMSLVQITDVFVRSAHDLSGRPVDTVPLTAPRLVSSRSSIALSSPTQVPVWFKLVDESSPVRELTGTLTARIRKPMADYLTIDSLPANGGAVPVQQDMTTLQVDECAKLPNGDYRLVVRLAHSTDVLLEGAEPATQRTQMLVARGGQMVITSSGTFGNGATFLGLHLRDALGQAYKLQGVMAHQQTFNPARAQMHQHVAQLVFRAARPDQGPPQRVVLRAASTTTVDVPFRLTTGPAR
jgi:hypothetical protein